MKEQREFSLRSRKCFVVRMKLGISVVGKASAGRKSKERERRVSQLSLGSDRTGVGSHTSESGSAHQTHAKAGGECSGGTEGVYFYPRPSRGLMGRRFWEAAPSLRCFQVERRGTRFGWTTACVTRNAARDGVDADIP